MEDREVFCELHAIHYNIVERVLATMSPEEDFKKLSSFYKVLGDNTRIKILYALQQEEMCVCDIAALLGMTRSAICHQLRCLSKPCKVQKRR